MTDDLLDPVLEDTTVTPTPLVVFVASFPDKMGNETLGLKEAAKIENLVLLHPCYDFNSDQGKQTLELIGDSIPEYEHPWENILRKDYFCIEISDLVIYDLDSEVDINMIAVAACYNKPIIAVSNTMHSVPAYFSGSVSCIVKPKQLAAIIKIFQSDQNFVKPLERLIRKN
jgi:hypothetical protein